MWETDELNFIDVELPEGKLRVYDPKDIGGGWIKGYVEVQGATPNEEAIVGIKIQKEQGAGKEDEATPE
jgi:hypothetical protein